VGSLMARRTMNRPRAPDGSPCWRLWHPPVRGATGTSESLSKETGTRSCSPQGRRHKRGPPNNSQLFVPPPPPSIPLPHFFGVLCLAGSPQSQFSVRNPPFPPRASVCASADMTSIFSAGGGSIVLLLATFASLCKPPRALPCAFAY